MKKECFFVFIFIIMRVNDVKHWTTAAGREPARAAVWPAAGEHLRSGFIDQLAGDVLRRQLQTQHPRAGRSDFLFNIGRIIREFQAQVPADLQRFDRIFNRTQPAEHDHTLNVQRPFARAAIAPVIHT